MRLGTLLDWGKLGMLEQIQHKSGIEMRAYFENQNPKVILFNRDATPRDLVP